MEENDKIGKPEYSLLDKRHKEHFDKLKIAEVKPMVIEVTKCRECRFLQVDNAARDWCRITQKDLIKTSGIPDFCPLRTSEITVKLKS